MVSWLAEDGDTIDRNADTTGTDASTVKCIYRKIDPESLADMADALASDLKVPTLSALSDSCDVD